MPSAAPQIRWTGELEVSYSIKNCRVAHGWPAVSRQGTIVRLDLFRGKSMAATASESIRFEIDQLVEVCRIKIGDVGDRVAGHHKADRVDQYDPTDPGTVEQCDFGRDPATDRVADHSDIPDVESVQQFNVRVCQCRDRSEVLGPSSAVEPRMDRCDDARAGARSEQVPEPGNRTRTGPTVQQQERLTAVTVQDPHPDPATQAVFGSVLRPSQVGWQGLHRGHASIVHRRPTAQKGCVHRGTRDTPKPQRPTRCFQPVAASTPWAHKRKTNAAPLGVSADLRWRNGAADRRPCPGQRDHQGVKLLHDLIGIRLIGRSPRCPRNWDVETGNVKRVIGLSLIESERPSNRSEDLSGHGNVARLFQHLW